MSQVSLDCWAQGASQGVAVEMGLFHVFPLNVY